MDLTECIGIDRFPEVVQFLGVDIVRAGFRSPCKRSVVVVVYPLAEDIIADGHQAYRNGKNIADHQDIQLHLHASSSRLPFDMLPL